MDIISNAEVSRIMMKILSATALTVLMAQSATAATILNGSFEATSPVNAFDALGTGSGAITDWTIDSGSVDFIGSYWEAAEGLNSIDMTGTSIGAISQLITDLTIGVKYMITFAMSGNPDNGQGPKFMTVNAGGETGTYEYVVGPLNSHATMKWDDYQFFFTAGSTSELLTFAALADNACCFGPALDNIRLDVAPVPLPASAPLIMAALGGLAALRRRRNRA
jgi:choice-of-anchor C domain-containing protein